MTALEPTFGSAENLTNISRNFAPIGIMALGMTVVLITGGIDLSVGSIMALVAIVAGLFLTWHYPWYMAFSMGMLTGLACGVFNGFFVAYVGMPSFVVTLGMMSIARSLAVVFSGNQMLYQFGPDAPIVKAIGQANGRCAPRRLGAGLDAGVLLAFLDVDRSRPDGRLGLQLHRLGTPLVRHRRQ